MSDIELNELKFIIQAVINDNLENLVDLIEDKLTDKVTRTTSTRELIMDGLVEFFEKNGKYI